MDNRTRIVTTAAVAVMSLGIWTSRASAQEPLPPVVTMPMTAEEPITIEKRTPNRPLLITGGAIIAASYTPALVVAATSGRDGDQYLYIPVAGPWIDLGVRGGCGPGSCGTEAIYKTLLVATGIAHAVGAAAVISSFLVPEQRTLRTADAKPHVVPTQMGKNGYGLSLVGNW